jgi:Rieske Fe-S protein
MAHAASPLPGEDRPGRRAFFKWLTWLASGLAAAAFGVPFVAYLLGPLRVRREEWVRLGPAGKFPRNETRRVDFVNPLRQAWDGMTANTGVFVRSLGQERFLVLAAYCTHLGCPVTWFPQSGLFLCPCHGGVYYENGDRASGPPPRGLFPCTWRVRDGQLEVRAPFLPTLQDYDI